VHGIRILPVAAAERSEADRLASVRIPPRPFWNSNQRAAPLRPWFESRHVRRSNPSTPDSSLIPFNSRGTARRSLLCSSTSHGPGARRVGWITHRTTPSANATPRTDGTVSEGSFGSNSRRSPVAARLASLRVAASPSFDVWLGNRQFRAVVQSLRRELSIRRAWREQRSSLYSLDF
jgi:hypothetical protein